MDNWRVTDRDSFQIRKRALEGIYELYQLRYAKPEAEYIKAGETRREYLVAHGFISVPDIDTKDILDCYGYGYWSVKEFMEEYGEDWEGVLAECEFEIHADERLIKTKPMSYDEARDLIVRLSGYQEPQRGKCLC